MNGRTVQTVPSSAQSDALVLVVEDDDELREALRDTLTLSGFSTLTAEDAPTALALMSVNKVSLVVSDVQMKGQNGLELLRQLKAHHHDVPVLLMTAFGTIQQAVDAMRDGAADYLVKPFEAEVLVGKVSRYFTGTSETSEEMVAVDAKSRDLLSVARRVAESDVSVMITGESGTGKEVLARYIHRRSRRSDGPFVAVNCAAIPENMLEAILFGYEKGAYTGALKACPGKFEQAQGGTIILDEVTEMDLALQAKLLRVLQEREVERLGGRELVSLDVRVLATSNRTIRDAISRGEFRDDLFYRLNVFPLHLLPLRERPDDIIPIAERLCARFATVNGKRLPVLSESARRRLKQHHWPGNVRELDNVIQRALVLQDSGNIEEQAIQFEDGLSVGTEKVRTVRSRQLDAPETLGCELKQREYGLILEALKADSGNRKAVAERLGISPRTLRYKLAQMRDDGISVPASRS